jgi:hypothetical protein
MNRFDDSSFGGWVATTAESPVGLLKGIWMMVRSDYGALVCWLGEDDTILHFQGMDLGVAQQAESLAPDHALWLRVIDVELLQLELFDLWDHLRATHRVTGGILPGEKQDFIDWKTRVSPPQVVEAEARSDLAVEASSSSRMIPTPVKNRTLSAGALEAVLESWRDYEEKKRTITAEQFVELHTLADIAMIYPGRTADAVALWTAEIQRTNIAAKVRKKQKDLKRITFLLTDVKLMSVISGSALHRARNKARTQRENKD